MILGGCYPVAYWQAELPGQFKSVCKYKVAACGSSMLLPVCGARRMSLAQTPAFLADRGTHCALAVSATGSARVLRPNFHWLRQFKSVAAK